MRFGSLRFVVGHVLQDLEVAADFNVSVTADKLFATLKDTGHVKVS